MRKNLLEEIVSKTTFMPGVYHTDGIQFRIGIVQDMPLFMSIGVSEVIFGDGWSGPAIIFSTNDIKKMIESKGNNYTGKFLSFVAGHEVGHMQQFKERKIDESIKADKFVVSNAMEIDADCYSMKHTGTSIVDYKDFMNEIKKGSRSIYAAIQGPILSKVTSFIDDICLDKRMINATARHKKSILIDMVYSKIVEEIIKNI